MYCGSFLKQESIEQPRFCQTHYGRFSHHVNGTYQIFQWDTWESTWHQGAAVDCQWDLLTLNSLYCSMSDSVESLLRFLVVKAWKLDIISCSSALSSIVLEALSVISRIFFKCQQNHLSLCYTAFCMAVLPLSILTRLHHTTLEVVDFPFTMTYNSGSVKDDAPLLRLSTWSRVSSVLFKGNGRKNIVIQVEGYTSANSASSPRGVP